MVVGVKRPGSKERIRFWTGTLVWRCDHQIQYIITYMYSICMYDSVSIPVYIHRYVSSGPWGIPVNNEAIKMRWKGTTRMKVLYLHGSAPMGSHTVRRSLYFPRVGWSPDWTMYHPHVCGSYGPWCFDSPRTRITYYYCHIPKKPKRKSETNHQSSSLAWCPFEQ